MNLIERCWDAVETFGRKHRRKTAVVVFVLVFLPQWLPAIRDSLKYLWALSRSQTPPMVTLPGWSAAVFSAVFGVVGAVVAQVLANEATRKLDRRKQRLSSTPSAPLESAAPNRMSIYTHISAMGALALDPPTVEVLFMNEGWTVDYFHTNLAVHETGVWVHGGDASQRAHAIELLKQLGVVARWDSLTEDVHLQVIIGRAAEVTAKASAKPGPTTPSRFTGSWGQTAAPAAPDPELPKPYLERMHEIGQEPDPSTLATLRRARMPLEGGVWKSQGVRAPETLLTTIELSLFADNNPFVVDVSIRAVNRGADVAVAAVLVVTDVRLWGSNQFVQASGIHEGGEFRPLSSETPFDLFHNEPTPLMFLRFDKTPVGFGYIDLIGLCAGVRKSVRITKPGTWRLSCYVQTARGRSLDAALCLQWDGFSRPLLCDCPKPAVPITKARRPPSISRS